MADTVLEQIRRARPRLGLEADHNQSRRAAIEMFCLDCVGGSRILAVECVSYACPLWPYRPGRGSERPVGSVPTREEYERLAAEKNAGREDDHREAGLRLAAARKKKGSVDPFEGLDADEEDEEGAA